MIEGLGRSCLKLQNIHIASMRLSHAAVLALTAAQLSDMDSTPKSLLQILDVINKCSNNSMHDVTFQNKHIEEEVDSILSVSAQTNQIIQDLLPDNEFDQDFTDAYMEEQSEDSDVESDKDEDDSQFSENSLHCSLTPSESLNSDSDKNRDTINLESKMRNTPYNNQCQEEITEQFSTPMARKNCDSSAVSPDKEPDENIVKRHEFHESCTKVVPRDESNFCEEREPIPTKYSACKNQYLAAQDACDKTSMLAYNLIGRMLEDFAIAEGLNLDLSKRSYLNCDKQIEDAKETEEQSSSRKRKGGPPIVRVIEELIPSFPDSSMERLKILMDL